MLHIYNSLSRKKEKFVPIEPDMVRMYVCGMTVYDYCHLGHARVLIVFDVVYRYLMFKGYEVMYIRNITDIDDKIIKRANENREKFTELTERFIRAMHEDTDKLGILPPSVEPRATENLDPIIAMIQSLMDKGYAYQANNGDVYYSVSRFERYGKLSGKKTAELRAGARVEVDEAKADPLDFVLWKAAKPEEPTWESPWGKGRPGWHIECSAMSTKHLGNQFDIHGGGQDLQFPHHENEIAQSEASTNEIFVNYWMHNGFVRINEEKMSKSLGNFFTVREILERYKPEEIRYFILSSHYRSPLNYFDDQLANARASLSRLYTALRNVSISDPIRSSEYEKRFIEAMDDDFNTADALAVLFDLSHDINKAKEEGKEETAALGATLKVLGSVLGLLQSNPDEYLKAGLETEISAEEIQQLIIQRDAARVAKNYEEADRIRGVLQENGIVLEDGVDGTSWKKE